MLRAIRVHRDERQIDRGLRGTRQFDFRFFRGFFETLQRLIIFAQVDAVAFGKSIGDVVHQRIVKIVAAQTRIARGRFHF